MLDTPTVFSLITGDPWAEVANTAILLAMAIVNALALSNRKGRKQCNCGEETNPLPETE